MWFSAFLASICTVTRPENKNPLSIYYLCGTGESTLYNDAMVTQSGCVKIYRPWVGWDVVYAWVKVFTHGICKSGWLVREHFDQRIVCKRRYICYYICSLSCGGVQMDKRALIQSVHTVCRQRNKDIDDRNTLTANSEASLKPNSFPTVGPAHVTTSIVACDLLSPQ